MDILLVALNSRYTHSNPAIYGLKTVLASAGFSAKAVEFNINANYQSVFQSIYHSINEAKKEDLVVGFSCYIWNVDYITRISKNLKKVLPKVKILWAGPEVSHRGTQILTDCNFVDYILRGEGEIALPKLLSYGDLNEVPNLSWRKNGVVVENEMAEYVDMSTLPFTYLDEDLQTLKNRIVYYESSRGCPFSCHFCISGKEPIRLRPLELVKADLEKLAQSGAQTIKFVDRTFNSNPKRAVELLEFLLSIYKENLHFHIEIEPAILSDEVIEVLQKFPTGYIQGEAGIQSLHLPTLEAVGRHNMYENTERNVAKLLENNNMHIHLDLIAGMPYENLEQFKAGFNKVYDLKPHYLQLGFLKILHGSTLADEATKYGLVYDDAPPYEVLFTPWLSYDEMLILKDCEEAVDHYCNEEIFKYTLDFALSKWQSSSFDFFAALGKFHNAIKGGISRRGQFKVLYDFIMLEFGEHESEIIEHLKVDCLNLREGLPDFLQDKTTYQVQDYAEEILVALPRLQNVQLRKWSKSMSLIRLNTDVAHMEAGLYVVDFAEKFGLWEHPSFVKIV